MMPQLNERRSKTNKEDAAAHEENAFKIQMKVRHSNAKQQQ